VLSGGDEQGSETGDGEREGDETERDADRAEGLCGIAIGAGEGGTDMAGAHPAEAGRWCPVKRRWPGIGEERHYAVPTI
jgi:hypothetical protein